MTKKERSDFNQMHHALSRIKEYQTATQLKKSSRRDWGLDYEESLEMAYENVIDEAKYGLKGVRKLKEE